MRMKYMISVNEALPHSDKPNKQYFVLVKTGTNENPLYSYEVMFYRSKEQDGFYLGNNPDPDPPPYGWWMLNDDFEYYSFDVVAWMECPDVWEVLQEGG